MHAAFWGSAKIANLDWMNKKDAEGNAIPVWFVSWLDLYLADPVGNYEAWDKCANEEGGFPAYTDGARKCFDLINKYQKDAVKAIFAKLNSRPKTMVHGDLRSDNLFRNKKDPTVFRTIDWQAVANTCPGIDFIQMLAGMLSPLEAFKELDDIYEEYIKVLHENCA